MVLPSRNMFKRTIRKGIKRATINNASSNTWSSVSLKNIKDEIKLHVAKSIHFHWKSSLLVRPNWLQGPYNSKNGPKKWKSDFEPEKSKKCLGFLDPKAVRSYSFQIISRATFPVKNGPETDGKSQPGTPQPPSEPGRRSRIGLCPI